MEIEGLVVKKINLNMAQKSKSDEHPFCGGIQTLQTN